MNNNVYMNVHFLFLFLGVAIVLAGCQQAEPQSSEPQDVAAENEELARQYIEAYNARDLDALTEILADRVIMNGEEYSRDDFLTGVQGYWGSFPDIDLQPTHIVGAEDHVTIRMDFTATGNSEYSGYDVDGREVQSSETILFHVSDGQLDEYWYNWDELGFWEQLGVVESPYPQE